MVNPTPSTEAHVTVYQRLRQLLADGNWHTQQEIEEFTSFPEEWIVELRYAGGTIVESADGERLVRFEEQELEPSL